MRLFIVLLFLLGSVSAFAGYDIHITRKPFWADEAGPRITFEQWQAYVRSDPQITRDQTNSPEDFMVAIPGESFPIWYNAQSGEVYTKSPSDGAIRKLEEIARSLGASVQGDDGEFYPPRP